MHSVHDQIKTEKKLGFPTFINMFFRSFFIQAVWNYQSMISVGFCLALVPVAKKLFKDRQDRMDFFNRHLNFFNAHPYFTSFALGAIARVEEDLVLEGEKEYYKVDRLRSALIGPLGAIGDQLVWATLKPASILIGMLLVLLIEGVQTKIIFLFILLALYNIPHIYIRFYGIVRGYHAGFEIYKLLNIKNFTTVQNIYGAMGALALGIIFGFSLMASGEDHYLYAVVFLLCAAAAYFYKKFKQSTYRSLTLPIILALLIGILVENI